MDSRTSWIRLLAMAPMLFGLWLTGASQLTLAGAAPANIEIHGVTPGPVLDGRATYVAPYSTSQTLHLVIALQPPQPAAEEQYLHDVMTRGTAQYHHFLTAEQWDAQFAPTAQAEQAVVNWANSQGLTVTRRYSNRLLVDIDASAGAIETALGIKINTYSLGQKTFYASDRDPTVPGTLGGLVQNIVGLSDLNAAHAHSIWLPPRGTTSPHAPSVPITESTSGGTGGNPAMRPGTGGNRTNGPVTPLFTNGYIDPPNLWSSYGYDVSPLYNQGHCCNPFHSPSTGTPPATSIAIATACGFSANDLYSFANQYGMATHWATINIDGGPGANNNCANATNGGFETTLDVEYATAMSNSFGCYCDTATVEVYQGPSSGLDNNNRPLEGFQTMFDEWNQIVSDNNVRNFSTSWGCYEGCWGGTNEDTGHNIFNNMLGIGISATAAAGDSGSYDNQGCSTCNPPTGPSLAVDYPAADPDVVAAGGSELHLYNDGSFNYETTWNGGGGGCSVHFAQPSFQAINSGIKLCPNGSNNGYMRSVPDVSLNASCGTGQAIYFNGGWGGVCGTSEVAPELAGLFAQLNAYLLYEGSICGSGGNGACASMGGNILYDIYSEAEQTGGGKGAHYPFYDITTGNNDNGQGTGTYGAGTGYDLATGFGSFNALQLAWGIMWEDVYDSYGPVVSYSGFEPATNHWFNSDQTVGWSVSDPIQGSDPAAAGVAGFTQGWDSIPADPFLHGTPGTGDSFYAGPQFPNATSGYLQLSWAGQGCHTANVQAWDNEGIRSGDQTYGPVCYDTISPISSILLDGAAPSSAPYGPPVTVNLSAYDPGSICLFCSRTGSGVAHIYYSVDGGVYQTYAGQFSIDGAGTHTVRYYSTDVAGNVESAHTVSFTGVFPTVTTLAASGVGATTATLNGTANLNGLSQGCARFYYYPEGNPAAFHITPLQTISGSGSLSVTASVTGLGTGTVYDTYLAVDDQSCGAGGDQTNAGTQRFLSGMPLTPGWTFAAFATNQDTTDAATALGLMNAPSVLNGHGKVLAVRAKGRWQLFVPGYTPSFPLTFGEGIVVFSNDTVSHTWLQTTTGSILTAGGSVALGAGWNVAAPVRESMTVAQICAATGATQVTTSVSGTATSYACASLPTSTPTIADTQSVYLLEPTAHVWTQP